MTARKGIWRALRRARRNLRAYRGAVAADCNIRCGYNKEKTMSRIWLLSVAVAALAGAASIAQAAPASSVLGTVKVATAEQIGAAQLVYWRRHHRHHYNYWRH